MSYLPDIYQRFERAYPTVPGPTRTWRRPVTRAAPSMLAALVSSSSGRDRSAGRGCRSLARLPGVGRERDTEEVRHVGLLALTTIGFPHTVAGLGWIDEVIASKD
jgi:4-carboxymuconolactone decarboxylase